MTEARGHHLTDDRRSALDALLLEGASYKDPRLASYSQSTITRARRRLGLSPPPRRGRDDRGECDGLTILRCG